MQHLQTIRFKSERFELIGDLHLPETPNPPFIIGRHGLFANRRSPKQIALAETCNKHGLAYLRFDHRGCGQSQGHFLEVTSLSARCADLYHAVRTMQQHPDTGPFVGLFGSSFGGTVVLAYSTEHEVPRLITYAAPYTHKTINHKALRMQERKGYTDSDFPQKLKFDLSTQLSLVANIMVVHGENDEIVPPNHAYQIHKNAKPAKKLVIQAGGDHRMSNPSHQYEFTIQFITWMLKGI